jgi:hypothetical protein
VVETNLLPNLLTTTTQLPTIDGRNTQLNSYAPLAFFFFARGGG